MASRTQLRLDQITGSYKDDNGGIVDTRAVQYETALNNLTLNSGSMVGVLSELASSIKRVHGGTTFAGNKSGVISGSVGTLDLANADGGTSTIKIKYDDGVPLLMARTDSDLVELRTQDDGNQKLQINTSQFKVLNASLEVGGGAGSTGTTINTSGQITTDGRVIIDDTTNATSTTDGSLQTDGGLSVALDSVFGDDVFLLSDDAVLNFGLNSDVNLTHIPDSALRLNAGIGLQFRDADLMISSSGDGTLDIEADTRINIGTDRSGVAISIGHTTSEVTVNDNLTVTGDLTVSGDTTTVSTTNLSIEDSIIGIGFSGSNPSTSGDRALLFGRGTIGSKLPGLYFDGTDFKLASTATDISSGSIVGTPSAGDYSIFRAGRILSENTTEATTTTDGALQTDGGLSVALSAVIGDDLDLLSNGAIFNVGNANKFTLTHQNANNTATVTTNHRLAFGDAGEYITGDTNDLTVVSGRDIVLDAASSIQLSFDGGPGTSIQFKDGNTELGILSGTLTGEAKGLIISSSAGGGINYDSNNGSHLFDRQGANIAVLSYDGADLTFGGSNDLDLLFTDDQMGSANEVFRIDADATTLALPTQNADGDSSNTGLLTFNGTTNKEHAIYSDGARMYIRSNNVNFKFPTAAGSANQVLITDGQASPTLSFSDLSTLTAASKAIRVITGSHSAGALVKFSAAAEITAGDTITTLSSAESQGATLDVYVNGQLLVSGSSTERAAGSRDYDIFNNGVRFAFDLEVDDIVQAIKR